MAEPVGEERPTKKPRERKGNTSKALQKEARRLLLDTRHEGKQAALPQAAAVPPDAAVTGREASAQGETFPGSGRSHTGPEERVTGADILVTKTRVHPDSRLALWQQALTRRDRPIREGWLEPVSAVGEELSLRRFPGYGREVAGRPPTWVAPSSELIQEVAGLSHYRQLFRDNGVAAHAAMEWARNPTGKEMEIVVAYDMYTLLARRVFEQGYVFRVEPESGKPGIQMVEPIPIVPTGVDRERLAQWAEQHDWPDQETIVGLRWGFGDHSDQTPRLCSFARNGVKTEEERETWRTKVAAEEEKGYVRRVPGNAENPYAVFAVPIVWRRTAVIPKPHSPGKWRFIVNRSLDKGEAHAPNTFSEPRPFHVAEWLSKSKVAEATAILKAVAQRAGLGNEFFVGGLTGDGVDWFKLWNERADEAWKEGYQHVDGGTVWDERLQMGSSSAPIAGERVGHLCSASGRESIHARGKAQFAEQPWYQKLMAVGAERVRATGREEDGYPLWYRNFHWLAHGTGSLYDQGE